MQERQTRNGENKFIMMDHQTWSLRQFFIARSSTKRSATHHTRKEFVVETGEGVTQTFIKTLQTRRV
ncbi:hypothetical protein DVG31_09675 [Salmonella enterica subsp. arizonae]|nr:hypothetical protein [Salmonella enterica subsp. arizonae]ECT9553110.1 hypothetical protein [Salmonella enterica subsp. arizonae serovar 41:z4,z23:-]